ncbi:hypothetical protein ACP4OV_017183 [Aristida adscensionis]
MPDPNRAPGRSDPRPRAGLTQEELDRPPYSRVRRPRRSVKRTVVREEHTPGAFESAAALGRQGFYAPFSKELPDPAQSEESITASTQTVQPPPPPSEKLLPDVSSSEELLDDAKTLKELFSVSPRSVPPNSIYGSPPSTSSLSLLGELPSEESMIASAQTVPHNTIDGSPPSASSRSPSKFLNITSSKEPITASPQAIPGCVILVRNPENLHQLFYIRMNHRGLFCMYPDLGGPFRSIDEADDAINRCLDELRRQESKKLDKLSRLDRVIHRCKYYLDGTPKRGPNSPTVSVKHYLMQALLDQYNEDHNLFGNLGYELEALVGEQWFCEDDMWYFHFNFRTKQKETDGINCGTTNLFFAEVFQMEGDAWEVTCCCIVETEDNGHCYGCRNLESPDMKHPNNLDAYAGGHLDGYLPFGLLSVSSDEEEEAEEARLREMFKGLDDPDFFDRIRRLTEGRAMKECP